MAESRGAWARLGSLLERAPGILVGLGVSLLALVPAEWLPPRARFAVGCALAGVLLLWILIEQSPISRLIARRSARKEALETLRLMPQNFLIRSHHRHCAIDEQGTAVVTHNYVVRNLNKGDLLPFCITGFAEAHGQAPSTTLQRVVVNGVPLEAPGDCMQSDGVLNREEHPPRHQTIIRVPLSEVNQLTDDNGHPLESEISIDLQVEIRNSLPGLTNRPEGEWVCVGVSHPTELMTLVVQGPPGKKLRINSDRIANGIAIEDAASHVAMASEAAKVKKPFKPDPRTIKWSIEEPRINYDYRLFFYVRD